MYMRKILFLLIILSLSFSQSFSSLVEEEQDSEDFPIVSFWKPLTIAFLILTVLLIAVARAVGQAFEFADLKAWANVELVQAIGTALIILALVSALSFLDVVFPAIINEAGAPVVCSSTDTVSCSFDVANAYNNDLIEMAENDVGEILKKSYNEGKRSSLRVGVAAHQWFLLQLSTSNSPFAQRILHIERYSQIIEQYNGILASLYAQRFFLTDICYKLGPVLLLAGLVTRSFFMTRKLGGLLLAISIGLMIVFPLMYVFDWVTLTVTIYGDATFEASNTLICPEMCTQTPAYAYLEDDPSVTFSSAEMEEKISNGELLSGALPIFDMNELDSNFEDGTVEIKDTEGNEYLSCSIVSGSSYGCPEECRYVPYPSNEAVCDDWHVRRDCTEVPETCKTTLLFDFDELPDYMQEQVDMCPDDCKGIPPLNPSCKGVWKEHEDDRDYGAIRDWDGSGGDAKAESLCTNAFESQFGDGVDMVPVSDDYCNYQSDGIYWRSSGHTVASVLIYEDIDAYCCFENPTSTACARADQICKVRYYEINDEGGKELLDGVQPDDCDDDDWEDVEETCPMSLLNAYDNCVYIIPEDTERCSGCLFVETGFTYDPAVAVNCEDMCGLNKKSKSAVSTGAFASASSGGLYGTPYTRNVSSFFVPAFVLPLFNILVTVMFIQTFSPLLGGDIELPGLSKIL